MSFDQLGLRVELLKAVQKTKGYAAPTPIQAKAIPVILDGRDILARAQTGTGKTDAFAIPLVEILSRKEGNGSDPRALVLAPTRELALQVGESIKAYARTVSLRCTVVYGGVRIEPQIERLKRGVDILVATPGRLLDLGFHEEISRILDLVPAERRTMLFSATYTQQVRNLADKMLRNPEVVEVTPSKTAAESVVQRVHRVAQANKLALLIHLIAREDWSQVLVFTRTKHGANRITEKLIAQELSAAALHGNKSQSLRTRTLAEFKSGAIRILVATDVAARGLDIINLPYVVNYDMPTIPEDYVHRIGRTGRAGVIGIAVSLVSHEEEKHLQAIENLLNQKIPTEKVYGYTEDSDVPDFVLYRPNNASSEKKASKDIKELVAGRNAAKQRLKNPPAEPVAAGTRSGSKPKKAAGRRNDKTAQPSSRPGSRSSKPVPQHKPKGRR